MKRKRYSVFLALIIATMSLAGCFGGGDGGSGDDETPVETLDDWQVHLVGTASDLPECSDVRNGWLYYVSADENFQVCTQNGWEIIDIIGSPGVDGTDGNDGADGSNGTNGIDGMDGANGIDGIDGQNGDDGQDGVDGISPMIRVLSSTSCTTGGNTFEIGYDNNRDGVLDLSEVVYELDICNGQDGDRGEAGQDGTNGQDGVDGADGQDGANGGSSNTLLTDIFSTNSSVCDAGGRIIKHGLDNGDGSGIAQNGILEPDEIDYSTTYCSKYRMSKLGQKTSMAGIYSASYIVEYQNKLYYSGYNASASPYSAQLWASDGTMSGTTMINNVSSPAELIVYNDMLYFSGYDSTHGRELWQSDGTSQGTTLLKDLNPGAGYSGPSGFTPVANSLFFFSNNGTDYQLWKTNGTMNSTVILKSGFTHISRLYTFGNLLLFMGNDGVNGHELWKSDGTPNGTEMVKDINSGASDSNPRHFTQLGNDVYFRANDGQSGDELWKSDGTPNGTVLVKDTISGSSGGLISTSIAKLDNKFYFSVFDNTATSNARWSIWESDGTTNGTLQVKGGVGSSWGTYFGLIQSGDQLYFVTWGTGWELWTSDGSTVGTQVVKTGLSSNPAYCAAENGLVYFSAGYGTNGNELWVSDGTNSGTNVVIDLASSSNGISMCSAYIYPVIYQNRLIFSGSDGTGQQLIAAEVKSDGTVIVDHEILYD